MIETFRNAWKVPELRRKLLFTFFIIVIYRIGGTIPVPYLDSAALETWFEGSKNSGDFFSYLNVLSGGNFSKATLMALSVGPYINAQIIIQLLTYALPPLERLSKEGMEGRKTLNKITKYTALGIALFQGWAYYRTLMNVNGLQVVQYTGHTFERYFTEVIIILCFVAGASLTIWLGDRINENGIGNGVSMLLFAGIIARGPEAVISLVKMMGTGEAKNMILVPIIIVVFILMIAFIIFMNNAERRIPIQYAKRVVGRKQYGGQNTYIPIKIAMSGVLPIIFAMSFMSIPQTLKLFTGEPKAGTFYYNLLHWFEYTHPFYGCLYFVLIIAFNYFYVSMSYNPVEIANNLRQNNGGVPGIRPGKPTSDYFQRILGKITLVGAVFLGIIAIFPIIFTAITRMNIAMGGTSILIVVSVALETARTMESQMMMRHHSGFLK
ncbi:preprotein translocase subunit SecY [Ruminococcus sp.]|uniref:preprotein translocase subunit SecY n=1 Tax=Ruminococcus sp. TaxID=41978 RepID=UPI0025F3B0EE|nr:preprotein translocase subunit SecY [Ruminococcus sp.]MBQ8966790.1 preprotein translocase subunit SecY [Ruminococcus sp.]